MIKFINNIDNLLNFILDKKKLLICFYDCKCNNSNYLTSMLVNADFDININICLIDKYQFLNNNYNKLNSNYINNTFYNNNSSLYYNKNFSEIVNSLSFLFYENIIHSTTPYLFFVETYNNIPTIKYSSVYYSKHDISDNILKMIYNFYDKNNANNIVNNNKIDNKYINEKDDLTNDNLEKITLYI